MHALTHDEQHRLTQHETVIAAGLQAFLDVGMALADIREHRLYRSAYPTFEAYCRDRWGVSSARARQLIAGVQVAESVSSAVTLGNERQARALNTFPEPMRLQIATLAEAEAVARGRALTEGDIRVTGEVLMTAHDTGYVDLDGNSTTATPATVMAAVRKAVDEKDHRWKQHRRPPVWVETTARVIAVGDQDVTFHLPAQVAKDLRDRMGEVYLVIYTVQR